MTSEPVADQVAETEEEQRSVPAWLVITGLGSLLIGGLTGIVWSRVVTLPSYTVQADGSATVDERALTQFFSADAWFVICGAVVGLLLGVAAWGIFKKVGWPVAFIAAASGLIAGVTCWQVGQLFGPGPFAERLAAARPTDQVPIALELHSTSALAVWAFVAVAPVLLGAALGPDEEAPRPPKRRRREVDGSVTEQVDDRGVLTTESAAEVTE